MPRSFAARDRIEGETRGVGARVARDEIGAAARGPDLELLDRGGAKRVAGRQHHGVSFGAEFGRQLADGRGLARAVDAGDQDDERFLCRVDDERLRDLYQRLLDLGRDHRLDLVGRDRGVMTASAQCVRDPVRGADAEIGPHQRIVDFLDRRLVEHALGDDIGDRGQRRRAAFEAAGEAPPPRLLGFSGFTAALVRLTVLRSFLHAAPVIAVSPR